MKIIMNVFESLMKLNNWFYWEIERFDIQQLTLKDGNTEHVGYVSIMGYENNLIIRQDGSFEFLKQK